METARVYTQFNEIIIDVARIGAYVAEMQRQKEFTDTDYCETVEIDDQGRVASLLNGRGEVVAEFDYDIQKEGTEMMYVCGACAVFKINSDYSGTDWSASRAEEIAENLRDYVIYIEEEPHFVMDHCSGCGVHGGDMYRARYYDEAN